MILCVSASVSLGTEVSEALAGASVITLVSPTSEELALAVREYTPQAVLLDCELARLSEYVKISSQVASERGIRRQSVIGIVPHLHRSVRNRLGAVGLSCCVARPLTRERLESIIGRV